MFSPREKNRSSVVDPSDLRAPSIKLFATTCQQDRDASRKKTCSNAYCTRGKTASACVVQRAR
eukprot:11171463-Lingulodinium_polyedra.AAC.1